MAKLSARGRTELARFTNGVEERVLMSDRTVLRKFIGLGGWNVVGKLGKATTTEAWIKIMKDAGWNPKMGRNGR